MANTFSDVKTAIYNSVVSILPQNTSVIWMYGNGQQPPYPYVGLHIINYAQVGTVVEEFFTNQTPTFNGDLTFDDTINFDSTGYKSLTKRTYNVMFRVMFFGNASQELGYEFVNKVDSVLARDLFANNGLSFVRKYPMLNIPKEYDTQFIPCHQLDVSVRFYILENEAIDGIESITINSDSENTITINLEIP